MPHLAASAGAQQPASWPDLSGHSAPAAQPDSPHGLTTLLDEILIAVKENDAAKYSAYFSSEVCRRARDPTLANSAMEAVHQWRYTPTTLNGAPVEVDTTMDVVFK